MPAGPWRAAVAVTLSGDPSPPPSSSVCHGFMTSACPPSRWAPASVVSMRPARGRNCRCRGCLHAGRGSRARAVARADVLGGERRARSLAEGRVRQLVSARRIEGLVGEQAKTARFQESRRSVDEGDPATLPWGSPHCLPPPPSERAARLVPSITTTIA